MMRHLALIFALTTGHVYAKDPEAAALRLADEAPIDTAKASDLSVSVEVAAGRSTLRNGVHSDYQRISLDAAFDHRLASDWRVVLAGRIDKNWHNNATQREGINTLKDSYISWQAQKGMVFDFGRINVHNGVATGYSPTDYFRANAVRSVVSADPSSLKKNRQGSEMLRTQALWETGSLSALYSPNRGDQPSNPILTPTSDATNNQDRWLLTATTKLSDGVSPQWLIYKEKGQPAQLGFNLSLLVNNSTIAYAEWSGGRSRSLFSQATNGTDDTAFRNRISTGLTYTTSGKLSLTLETQYNGAALSDKQWRTVPLSAPLAYTRYRSAIQNRQELPTRRGLLLYASWRDAFLYHLDLSAFIRYSQTDSSSLSWVEARYHWERYDAAIQLQVNRGGAGSEFGASAQRHTVQLLLRYYFH